MNSLQCLFAILHISQDTLCMKLQQCVGKSNEDVNAFCTNWILGEIEQQYEAVCDNLQILDFLEKTRSSLDGKDVQMRLMLYGVVKGYNYYEGPAEAIMQPLEAAIENHETMRSYRKFLYKVISQLDIPAPSRLYGCLRLLEYEDCREFVKERLQELFTIGTVIDRYYALCAYKHICSYSTFRVSSSNHGSNCFMLRIFGGENDFDMSYYLSCFGLEIETGEPVELSEDIKLFLKESGRRILTTDYVPFTLKLLVRQTNAPSTISGFTRFPNGFRESYFTGGVTDVDVNYSKVALGKQNEKEYVVKVVQNTGEGSELDSYNYSAYDYLCMIGMVTNNPELLPPYFDTETSFLLFPTIGCWLLKNNAPVQDVFYQYIRNLRKSTKRRLFLANCLRPLSNPEYVKEAQRLLQNDQSIVLQSHKRQVAELYKDKEDEQ